MKPPLPELRDIEDTFKSFRYRTLLGRIEVFGVKLGLLGERRIEGTIDTLPLEEDAAFTQSRLFVCGAEGGLPYGFWSGHIGYAYLAFDGQRIMHLSANRSAICALVFGEPSLPDVSTLARLLCKTVLAESFGRPWLFPPGIDWNTIESPHELPSPFCDIEPQKWHTAFKEISPPRYAKVSTSEIDVSFWTLGAHSHEREIAQNIVTLCREGDYKIERNIRCKGTKAAYVRISSYRVYDLLTAEEKEEKRKTSGLFPGV